MAYAAPTLPRPNISMGAMIFTLSMLPVKMNVFDNPEPVSVRKPKTDCCIATTTDVVLMACDVAKVDKENSVSGSAGLSGLAKAAVREDEC